jgi:hypothetical protein
MDALIFAMAVAEKVECESTIQACFFRRAQLARAVAAATADSSLAPAPPGLCPGRDQLLGLGKFFTCLPPSLLPSFFFHSCV